MDAIKAIFDNFLTFDVTTDRKLIVMWTIGGLMIFLAIKKQMEPSLLLPMGLGAILVNLPNSGVITRTEQKQIYERIK